MALALQKIWNFTSRLYPYLGVSDQSMRDGQWGMKDILVAMGWTVEGGYSNEGGMGLHNNDQFDVWPDRLTAGGTADTWLHMKAPAASPMNVEIAFGTGFAGGAPENMFRMSLAVSTAAGFGTVNGGSNGSTSDVPHASDEHEILDFGLSTATHIVNSTHSWYGAWSTDLKHFRLMLFSQRVLAMYLAFDIPDNPRADIDDNDVVFTWRYTGTAGDPVNTVLDQDFYTSPLYRARVNGNNRTLYLGTSGYANLGLQSHNTVLGDQKMVVHHADLYNNTLNEKGYMGTIPDLYYGNNNQIGVLLGDTVGGSAVWMSGGSIITPWDPTEPRPRVF